MWYKINDHEPPRLIFMIFIGGFEPHPFLFGRQLYLYGTGAKILVVIIYIVQIHVNIGLGFDSTIHPKDTL